MVCEIVNGEVKGGVCHLKDQYTSLLTAWITSVTEPPQKPKVAKVYIVVTFVKGYSL